ncbi:quinoprotein dehydrogenase-associated SoxYZ-like carrier [Labrenzia suaedae]|uniref:Quinoprotein dehydrogenase-associated SoxYZ-like carrier n=2 Tax=Roseibium litorale TaxID=2803841 RepID=A0ABR9CJK6_9HYPH|nr:quinoprotein dehydrogenase-associated SoxYZ-like carrier [Roseibium litorale]
MRAAAAAVIVPALMAASGLALAETKTPAAGKLSAIPAAKQEPAAPPLQPGSTWEDLKADILGDQAPADGSGIISVGAPYRANDAATVPIVLSQPSAAAPRILSAKLIIDENPAPVAATLTFGAAMHPLDMELRVRVNQYSNVRLVADTEQGPVMTGRFVKASGGCSAPATRDPQLALSTMGEIRVRNFPQAGTAAAMSTPEGQRRETQVMIRHPNYSGLQRDQITQLFIAAHFIDKLDVYQGDDLLFSMEGGISISENPVFRFSYTDNGSPDLKVHVEDTEGNSWEKTLPKQVEG